MFRSARFKLTSFYLIIIMAISGLFSLAFYQASTREIDRIMRRLEFDRPLPAGQALRLRPGSPEAPSIEELLAYKGRIQMTLIIVNGLILVLAGGAGWFLAGKTLFPIKKMVDEQNLFISDASHELRTPLATLQAETEGALLEKKMTLRKARIIFKSNLEELGRLKKLTDSLLRLTKTHHLKLKGQTKAVSLLEVIKISQKRVLSLARKKKIKINLKMPEMIVKGDKDVLAEAFLILLENAVKYSPAGSTITVKGEKTDHRVKVAVIDQGVGISKKDLPFIFERFYRADKSRSLSDGFGLGLSIAKKIINAHKGSIKVKSKIKKGTTFVVELPLVTA